MGSSIRVSTKIAGGRSARASLTMLAPVTRKKEPGRPADLPKPAPAPTTRRRRPRETTRELLLCEAEDLLVERLTQGSDSLNPLAAIRITDVLGSINARRGAEPAMTTGAAYQIWDSQTAFQDELLDRIMRKVSVPWEERSRASMKAAMDAGLPIDDVIAALGDIAVEPRESVELSLAAGLSAFVAPKRIRRAEKKANAQYVRVLGGMLEEILAYAGRQVRSGLTIADIVWSIEAIEVGYNLRERSHPELLRHVDAHGRSVAQLASIGIVLSMSESIPGRRPAKRRRSS